MTVVADESKVQPNLFPEKGEEFTAPFTPATQQSSLIYSEFLITDKDDLISASTVFDLNKLVIFKMK